MHPITVQTIVKNKIETVWNAMTDPKHIVNWNFAEDTWHCPKASNDLRPGGKLSATMAAKDGSFSFELVGIYDEIRPLESIRYTLADGRKVALQFHEKEGTVVVTETFDPESVNPVEMQQAGWQMILNNFAKYAESL